MSNFSKIVIIILILLSFFFIKDKYGEQINNLISQTKTIKKIEFPFNKQKKPAENNKSKPTPEKIDNKQKNEKTTATIYFLALDSNDNGIYKRVQREVPSKRNKLEFAIEELIKGPNVIEKSKGAYSEIPKGTKILSIKSTPKKIIINLNSDFQYGGGTDSIYSRMMQLIKTAINNSKNKNIYLYLDGKEVNTIGGEGIMITQPLNEKSLEI